MTMAPMKEVNEWEKSLSAGHPIPPHQTIHWVVSEREAQSDVVLSCLLDQFDSLSLANKQPPVLAVTTTEPRRV